MFYDQFFKNGFLWISFCIASGAAIFQSAFFPRIGLLAYAPFLAIACMRTSLTQTLWLALFSGLFLDLLTSTPFGLYAANFFSCTLLAQYFKKHFFREEFTQICFLSALISFFFTPLYLLFFFLLDQKMPFDWQELLFDLLAMPLCDALYAFLFFIGPLFIYDNITKQWKLWRLQRND